MTRHWTEQDAYDTARCRSQAGRAGRRYLVTQVEGPIHPGPAWRVVTPTEYSKGAYLPARWDARAGIVSPGPGAAR